MKLEVALRQLAAYMGCEPKDLDLDHTTALVLRPVNEAGTDYDPPQHDPNYLEYKDREPHRVKTHGRKGESKFSSAGNGDTTRGAKAKRLEEERIERARNELLRVEGRLERGERKNPKGKSQWPQGRKIESRGFQKKTRDRSRAK